MFSWPVIRLEIEGSCCHLNVHGDVNTFRIHYTEDCSIIEWMCDIIFLQQTQSVLMSGYISCCASIQVRAVHADVTCSQLKNCWLVCKHTNNKRVFVKWVNDHCVINYCSKTCIASNDEDFCWGIYHSTKGVYVFHVYVDANLPSVYAFLQVSTPVFSYHVEMLWIRRPLTPVASTDWQLCHSGLLPFYASEPYFPATNPTSM